MNWIEHMLLTWLQIVLGLGIAFVAFLALGMAIIWYEKILDMWYKRRRRND